MGELLQFPLSIVVDPTAPRGKVYFMPERWGTMDLSTGETQGMPFPPEVLAALETGPGGSLQGATSEEVQAAALEANPMRLLVTRVCGACGRQWQQPSREGRCPVCHADAVTNVEERVSMAQRLK